MDEAVDEFSAVVGKEVEESSMVEEMELDVMSDAHSDTHSETSLFLPALVLKEGNSSDVQNREFEDKLKQDSDTILKKATKRVKRARTKRIESDDDNEDEEKEEDIEINHKAMLSSADRKIQVGDDFQARVNEPQKEQKYDAVKDEKREDVLWCPPADINEVSLNQYCEYAAEKHQLAEDQALYLLQKSNFDFDIAREKVKRRRTINEEWSDDDRALFKQALHMFGKRFDKIRQMMPYRSMSSIIQFYYNTKKDTDYKSLIDIRMAEESEDEDCADDQDNGQANMCGNCGEECRDVRLCYVCWTYFRSVGKQRPCNYVSTVNEISELRKRKCPNDMVDIAHSFVEMSRYIDKKSVPGNENVVEGMEIVEMPKTKCYEETKAMMRELAKVRARALHLEYSMKSQRFEGLAEGLDSYRYLAVNDRKDEEELFRRDRMKGCESWTTEERIVAFRCLIRYEEDFDAVSEVLGTKTPEQVKSFYMEVKSDVNKVLRKLAASESDI